MAKEEVSFASSSEDLLFYMPENRFEYFFCENSREMGETFKTYKLSKDSDLAIQMVELFLFHHAMQIMRIPWHPGTGRGSQAREFYLHKRISNLVIEREQKGKNKWLEENILQEDEKEEDITKTSLWYL